MLGPDKSFKVHIIHLTNNNFYALMFNNKILIQLIHVLRSIKIKRRTCNDLRSLLMCWMISKPHKNVSKSLATFPSLHHFVSTPRILFSNNKYFAFTFTYHIPHTTYHIPHTTYHIPHEQSKHEEIVFIIKKTICDEKSIFIEIKTSSFVFYISQISERVNNYCRYMKKFNIIYKCIMYESNYMRPNHKTKIILKYLNLCFYHILCVNFSPKTSYN